MTEKKKCECYVDPKLSNIVRCGWCEGLERKLEKTEKALEYYVKVHGEDIFTIVEGGEVVLRFPIHLSPDTYAELKDWIDIVMRKIGRSVQEPDNLLGERKC